MPRSLGNFLETTPSGTLFSLSRPDHRSVSILDIALALSREVRYSGFGARREPYSVGEHSLRCSWAAERAGLSKQEQYWALMHDAHEAYTKDMPTPAKREIGPAWYAFERKVARAVAKALRLRHTPAVARIDRLLLHTEMLAFMPSGGKVLLAGQPGKPPPASLEPDVLEARAIVKHPWTHSEVAIGFLTAFLTLAPMDLPERSQALHSVSLSFL